MTGQHKGQDPAAEPFRRFLTGIILIPAMIIRRSRSITVRMIGYQPSLDRLYSAWHAIERTRFG